MVNDIFPKLTYAKYLTLINAGLRCHNLKHEEKSSYLATFSCQFGRYRYKRLPFRAAPAADMFEGKIGEISKELQNVVCTADDILILGYDKNSIDHDRTLFT